MKRENRYQSELMARLGETFPGTYIYKTSPYAPQGFPDITISHESGLWAYLECKKSADEPRQPNQEWYVERLNTMGFAAFIYPENEERVICDLDTYLNESRYTEGGH